MKTRLDFVLGLSFFDARQHAVGDAAAEAFFHVDARRAVGHDVFLALALVGVGDLLRIELNLDHAVHDELTIGFGSLVAARAKDEANGKEAPHSVLE